MAVVFARIRVADLDRWKAAFLESDEVRRGFGLTTRSVFRDATYANGVIVVLNAEDLERAQEFFSSEEQRQRMARSGIERPAEWWMGTDFPGLPQ